MKKYFAFVGMYLAMSWWFLWTGIFVALAMPAKLVVERLSAATNEPAPKFSTFADRFSIN